MAIKKKKKNETTTLYKLLMLQVRTGYKRLITTRKERQAVAKGK